MANTVYDSKTIGLQDGTDVTLVPLPLGRLKRFMDAWEQGFEELKKKGDDARDVDVFPIYIHCCGIALQKEMDQTGKFEKTVEKDGSLTDEYREWLEDTLDQETIFEILDRAGNLKLRDPKILEAAERLAAEQGGAN